MTSRSGNDKSEQGVQFTRFIGGLRGDLPFGQNWKYDANFTVSRTNATYSFESFLTDRIYNSLYVVPVTGSTTAATRTVNGVTYTCASNVGSSNPNCVPAPILDASFLAGNIDQAYRDYVFKKVTGHTKYDEVVFTGSIDGTLLRLPAGDMRSAIGVEVRSMKLNDHPSQDSINNNLYLLTSSGISTGKDAVREAFAEVEAPLLRGHRGAEDLTINLSGRITEYNSYGSDHTYKAGFTYTPVSWLKLRGTRGSSFRAPALFEQYLSPTSGFLSGSSDPCYLYGTEVPVGSVRYNNCLAAGLPLNWQANNGVQINSFGGAAAGLKSENSYANSLGAVIQPAFPASVGDIALAVDWWRITIQNEVTLLGSGVARSCYDDPNFTAGGRYCAYIHRDANHNLSIDDYYTNIATQVSEGVDYNIRYARDAGIGRLTLDLRATRYLRQDQRLIPTDPLDRFNGTLQYPKWVGDIEAKYKWKDWTIRYAVTYVGSMDSNAYVGVDPTQDPYNFKVGYYTTQDLSFKYESPAKWSAIVGVRNLSNEAPKTITAGSYDRVGNSLLYSGYDYYGRRVFLTLSKSM
jgi:iron complex outermembrane recepter protein